MFQLDPRTYFTAFSKSAGPIAVVVGCTVLAGWCYDIQVLKSINPHWISMAVNTSISFILIGFALALVLGDLSLPVSNHWKQAVIWLCILMTVMLGASNLMEYLFGLKLNIHELFFKERKGAVGSLPPNRMAFTTAFCFIMLSSSIFLLSLKKPALIKFSQYLAFTSGMIGFLTVIAYIYGIAPQFEGLAYYTQMAANTAMTFVILSMGILCARPDTGIMEVATSNTAGGMVIRKLFPAIFLLTITLGWMSLFFAQNGYFDIKFGISLLVLSIIIVFVALVTSISRELYTLESQRETAIDDLRESELQRSHQIDFTKAITTQLGTGIFAVDMEGNISFLNPAGEKLLGWSATEVIGQPSHCLDAIMGEGVAHPLPDFNPFLKAMNRENFNRTTDDIFTRKNGSQFPVSFTITPIISDDVEIGALCCFLDISERKALQNQLIQSQKMESVGLLAAGIAHEINNPVGFVMSNVRSLKRYVDRFKKLINWYDGLIDSILTGEQSVEPEEIKGKVESIKKENKLDIILEDIDGLLDESLDGTERIKEIVQGLKSFSRADDGRLQEANINECLETTLKVIWNELKYNSQVHKNLGDLPLIVCNPGQLNQVFMNLLVNAAQAIPEQGDITIETYATDAQVVVTVTDTGTGIPPEALPNIFNPFFTTKEVGKGTGLGLSISYGIIQSHHGTIEVDSKLNEGTKFTIRLPIEGVRNG